LRSESSDIETAPFSEPVKIFVNEVKSIDTTPPMVNLAIVPKSITCLRDAVALDRKVAKSLERKLRPRVGDIVCVIEDDPTNIYKQVLFAIVRRGKV